VALRLLFTQHGHSGGQAMKSFTQHELLAIRDRHESWLRSQPGVVGTGIGMDKAGKICIKVFTDRISPSTRNAIYEHLSDLPVALEEMPGGARKQADGLSAASDG
jgi:hypothetical protein